MQTRLFALLFLFLASSAGAQVCTDYVVNEMEILAKLTDGNRSIYNIALEGDVAFMTSTLELHAVDISNPAVPRIIGSYRKTMTGEDVAVIDGLLCMISYNDSLQILDVTDPTNMTLMKTISTPPFSRSVISHGDYFYIAAGNSGLITIDATDPADPVLSSVSDPTQFIAKLAVSGDYLYTVGWSSHMCVYSLADPGQPVRVHTGNQNSGYDLEIVGDYIYTVTYPNHQLGIYRIPSLTPIPVYAGTKNYDSYFRGLTSIGDVLFGTGDPFVSSLDLSDPADPRYMGRYLVDKEAGGAIPYGDVLLAGVSDHLLVTVDVSLPESTVPLDTWSTVSPAYDIDFFDDYYLLGAGGDGLQVWDYGQFPQKATLALTDTLYEVKRDGDLAYLAIDEDGLAIADLSDPTNPVLIGGVNSSSQARDVDVYTNASGTYALLAIRQQDLIKYDVTDPTNISFYGLNSFPGLVYAVEVVGDFLLVADTWGHVNVMDLSVFPDQPEVVAVLEVPGPALSLHVEDDLCYVGGEDFLGIVDITDPVNPVLLGHAPNDLPVTDIAIDGTVAYGVSGGYGMVIVNVGNPADPIVHSKFRSSSYPGAVGVHGDQVYLCTLETGLEFLPLQCTFAPSAVETPFATSGPAFDTFPNPFNPRTTIRFECQKPGPVQLAVYDLAGRKVAGLVDGWMEAGYHERVWNGRDRAGRVAASGPYLVRLKTSDGIGVEKILLAK